MFESTSLLIPLMMLGCGIIGYACGYAHRGAANKFEADKEEFFKCCKEP